MEHSFLMKPVPPWFTGGLAKNLAEVFRTDWSRAQW